MTEYIEREALCKILENWRDAHVVHGQWRANRLNGYDYSYACSNCGMSVKWPYDGRHSYCSHCGAKMDGGVSNATEVVGAAPTTRIERCPGGSYRLTVNGKIYECEDTQAMLSFLDEVGDGKT